MKTPAEFARACFTAYETKDRPALEALLAADFTFTSPLDDCIDRDAYFERCWPNIERCWPNSRHLDRFEIESLVEDRWHRRGFLVPRNARAAATRRSLADHPRTRIRALRDGWKLPGGGGPAAGDVKGLAGSGWEIGNESSHHCFVDEYGRHSTTCYVGGFLKPVSIESVTTSPLWTLFLAGGTMQECHGTSNIGI